MPHSSIDEQVVKMSFDSSNFDSNINASIKALNSLDSKLGILNKNNFSNLTTNIDNLAKTFTVKGQVMLGVLTSLGNKIVNLGNQAFKKLTQGIRDGLGEYNQIIDSTQTIYQNVKQDGKSIEDVNNALDELNDYADKTVYNFGQMTRMIGMFTSAGVSLDKSVSSIKGLANAAALVGATMERAQIGWQAVSRAMSSGKFTNVTWRSLELSGIAGKQFNKVITEAARANKVVGKHGQNIDQMIKKYGSLRESLREGWLTKDLFTEAMDIMSGALSDADLKAKGYTDKQIEELRAIADAAEEAATRVKTFKQLMETTAEAIGSGWAQSFRILIGDLEQAKKLYTRISDVINDFIDNNSNIRNTLFKKIMDDRGVDGIWKSGRDNFKQIIENMLAIVKTFLKTVKTGFLNIFPVERISKAARKILDTVQKFTKALVLNNKELNSKGEIIGWDTKNIEKISDAIKDLIRFFRGLASAVDIAWMAISQPIKVIIQRIPFFNNFFENTNSGLIGIIKKLGQFGDKITAFRDVAKDWEIFGYVMEYFLDNIDELGKKYPVLGAILWVFNGIKKAISGLKESFNNLGIKPLNVLFGIFKMVVTSVWKVLNAIFDTLRKAKNSVDWSWLDGPKKIFKNVLKVLNDYGAGVITFEQATEKIRKAAGGIISTISNIINKFFGSKKLAKGTGEVTKSFSNLNVKINDTGKKITSIWDKIEGFFAPIGEFFAKIGSNADFTFDGIIKKIALLGSGIGAAALSISHLSKTFAKVQILNNLNELLSSGIDVVKAYQKQIESKMILNIALAIGILAASMALLSFIPYKRLEDGLVIFSSFLAVVSMTLTPLLTALAKFNTSLGQTKKQLDKFDVMNNLVKQVGKFGKRIAAGLNAKMIGAAFKDVAMAIFILVGALAALVLLFKYDAKNLKKSVDVIKDLIITLAVSVGVLVVAIEILSKIANKTKNSVDVFATFFKLAGISSVLLSIAAAVSVLVVSLAIMTGLDQRKLRKSWDILKELVIIIGVIAVAVTAVSALTSLRDNIAKVNKVSLSLVSSMLAISTVLVVMSYMISKLQGDKVGAWSKTLIMFTAIATVLATMVAALLLTAKRVGGETAIWNKLQSTLLIMTASLLAIAGVLYVIGKEKPIPETTIKVIKTILLALGLVSAIMVLIASIMAAEGGVFSKNFINVIAALSLSIATLVASFGILAIGIGSFISSINSLSISSEDSDKASTNLVKKLQHVSETISKSMPELKKTFYNVGYSLGTVVTSFLSGFADRVIEVGDVYNEIAEKFVNLAIDILWKVVNVLYERKDDISQIISKIIEFLGTEITAALNAFFKKDGEGLFKEEDVLKWMGVIGLSGTGAHIVFENIKDWNAVVIFLTNIKKAVTAFIAWFSATKLGTLIGSIFTKFGPGVTVIDKTASAFSKFAGALWNVFAVITAVVGAIAALFAVGKKFNEWFLGEEEWIDPTFAKYKNGFEALKENLLNIKFIGQSVADGFERLGLVVVTLLWDIIKIIGMILTGIVQILATVADGIMLMIEKIIGLFDKKAAKAFRKIRKESTGYFRNYLNDVQINIGDSIKFDWDMLKNEFYTGSYEAHKQYIAGGDKALKDYGPILKEDAIKNAKDVIEAEKTTYDEHSPSKVSYNIYWNYIKGASNALTAGGKELLKVMKSNNKKLIKENITGTKELSESYKKLGVNNGTTDRDKNIHDYKVQYTSYWDGDKEVEAHQKTVELNEDLTEHILTNKEELINMSKAQARAYIEEQNRIKGLGASQKEVDDLVNYLYDQHAQRDTIWMSDVERLERATTINWMQYLDEEEFAMFEAVRKQEEANGMLMNSADELRKKLVGTNKQKAAEILKQDLVQKGMSEEQAEEESKKMVALIFANQKNQKQIKEDGLTAAISIMKAETDVYEENLKTQTKLLDQAQQKRLKMEENYNTEVGRMAAGTGDVSSYLEASRKLQGAKKEEADAKKALDDFISDRAKQLEKNKLLNADQFGKDYEDAYKKISANNKKASGNIKDTLKSFWNTVLGYIPKGIDTTGYNFPNTGNTGNKGTGNDSKTAIDAAKDLKKGLEAQRADLTPTFDLDQLASDANKANGIVMSSLMAAQNASIGDYINQSSELNPFMKDRWQNVYNFTQNNYSPKALSRIDIYRQTQRQISMSRGF